MTAVSDTLAPPAAASFDGVAISALDRLAAVAEELGRSGCGDASLQLLAEVGAQAVRASVAVVRLADPTGRWLAAKAIFAPSAALAAELQGSRVQAVESSPDGDAGDGTEAVQAVAARLGTGAALQVPVVRDGRVVAALDFFRTGQQFSPAEESVARLAAVQLGLALAGSEDGHGRSAGGERESALELVAEALGTAAEEAVDDAGADLARALRDAAGADAALLWRDAAGGLGELVARSGAAAEDDSVVEELRGHAERAIADRAQATVVAARLGAAREPATVVTVRLAQAPLGALQLALPAAVAPSESELRSLARLGARAGRVFEFRARAERLSVDLDQTRALLAIVGQAIAQLSLAHTLETAIDRVAELLDVDRVAIYLRGPVELEPAAARGVDGPHAHVGERLLELALGPLRGRGLVFIEDAAADRRLASIAREVRACGIEAALGIPLVARGEVVGLLAAYPPRSRRFGNSEAALAGAVAAQLAVAVENARLHEHAKRLGTELEQALSAERTATRELRALYEISRSFAQSLSLETTLEAIARAVVESFGLDAAVIRLPDERGESLVMRAMYVADASLHQPIRLMFSRSQPMDAAPVQRLLRTAEPLLLDPRTARELETSHNLLAPFLEKGSTAGVFPIATPSEVVGTLTLLSLDPSRPLRPDTIETARSIARQAALAVDNARLYQQQKRFADTMQRSLLPRSRPALRGLDLGDVYESSARVDVGGDVYDYIVLPDGRLAVVVGDVTGHGIEATADMAMVKFVFRSLSREHPDPSDFLASANEVLVGEIPVGKFVTMVCVTIDQASGELACANAGHPQPRLLRADGTVEPVGASGIALGIENDERYPAVRDVLGPGAAIVLYTDGVIEARRDAEQYGAERLDAVLTTKYALPAQQLASAVVDDCRAFVGGQPDDDTAVVVIRRVEPAQGTG